MFRLDILALPSINDVIFSYCAKTFDEISAYWDERTHFKPYTTQKMQSIVMVQESCETPGRPEIANNFSVFYEIFQ